MPDTLSCPLCHAEVGFSDCFCANCGKLLKSKPLSTSAASQIIVYLKSFFLPPWGLFIGLKYLRQNDKVSKLVGIAAIILTFISLIIAIKVTLDLVNSVNSQIDNQLQLMNY